MNLIIVESPTKSKTLKKFLGKNYQISASMGHIRDLPKSKLGIDIEKNFEPQYIIPLKARKTMNALKKEAEKADKIILGTDMDREGEAIAWHLTKILDLKGKNYQRIVFHEITKEAIQEALKNPRKIDLNLVDAQQARRILDRIVGYKLSPFLWKKVARGLSAGRVQSVAVRLVVEREKEINDFIPQEYWNVEAELQQQNNTNNKSFLSKLIKKDKKKIQKLGIKTKEETNKIIQDLKKTEYKISNIEKKEARKNPLPPFTTSALQQESWKKLHLSAKFTMRIAQQLYEKGHITYHRTDSLNLSDISLFTAKKFIIENYGKNYWAGFLRKYKAKGKVQEAHEAIRPAYPDKTPDILKEKLDDKQFKLYDLIWRRFIACQMNQAVLDQTKIDIQANNYTFRANGQIMKFEGFLKIYPMKFEENELPNLEKDEILELLKLIPSQHFTQPPARYTEASLIKTLEENGIGRPSTYAPTLSTIQDRNYIEKNQQKRFQPTEIGTIVNNLLVKHFPKIVDVKFTAEMEKDLDRISEGKINWRDKIREFYIPFAENLEKKEKEVPKEKIAETPTDKKCPECKSPIIIKLGRFGKFYACTAFPKCKYSAPLEKKKLGIKCPKCQKGDLVEKITKRKKIFYACDRYPKCDFALWDKPIKEQCQKCKSLLVEKEKKIKCSNKDCDFEKV